MVAPARAFIMREYDHHVIEAVIPPEVIMARGVGEADQPIIVAILRCVAPAIPRADRAHG
jgi:hypothetical protein